MSDLRQADSVGYISDTVGGRTRVDWLSSTPGVAGPEGARAFIGEVEVYTPTADGVTWLFGVAPITAELLSELASDAYRRLRHPDGWVLVVDAQDPEFLWVEPDLDGHLIEAPSPTGVAVRAGSLPTDDELRLLYASGGTYRMGPALSSSRLSQALSLWCAALVESETNFAWRETTPAEEAAIRALAAEMTAEPSPETDARSVKSLAGLLDDAEDLMGGGSDLWWAQRELGWPDADGSLSFAGAVQVQVREGDYSLGWLAQVLPREQAVRDHDPDDLVEVDGEGWSLLVPIDDPYTLYVPCDRAILAVGRTYDAYEAYGVSVPIDEVPAFEVFSMLRRALAETDAGTIVRTPAWSEDRISDAVAVWLEAGTGRQVEVYYDEEDPVSTQGEAANAALAEMSPPEPAPPTRRCMHRRPDALPFELGGTCDRPDEFYFTGPSGEVVFVCAAHLPEGAKASPVLRH